MTISHLARPYGGRAWSVSSIPAWHARHSRRSIGRNLGCATGHRLAATLAWGCCTKYVGEGILALRRRGRAELLWATIVAALLGVILRHAIATSASFSRCAW